jgi:preprotein translocase subunit SecA
MGYGDRPRLSRCVRVAVVVDQNGVVVPRDGGDDWLGIDNLYESLNTPLVGYLNNALKAKELYKRDKDYIVSDGEVLIVDEFTGRILYGRRYNEGMHQAIEAKHGVEIKQENQTLATITLQKLVPSLPQVVRHDRYRRHRGGRVQQGLQG